ncbi:unnamed protein product [Ascophyllum nodosum]
MEKAAVVANQAVRVTAGSKRQDSGDTDDDLGLGDTEGPDTLEDLPLTPYAETAESFSTLAAAAEKYNKLLISFGRRRWHSILYIVYYGRQQQKSETESHS